MTTEDQAEARSVAEQLAGIEKRIARIQFFTAWMLTLMVVGAVAFLIISIVIANGVHELTGP